MMRPDEILFAAGGRIMDRLGAPYVQNARIGQDNGSTFSRTSVAWARVQRNKWAQVPAGVPRWEITDAGRLSLVVESTNANLIGGSAVVAPSTSLGWVAGSTLETFPATGVSMLQGQTVRRFTYGGSTAPFIYQNVPAPSTGCAWYSMSAIVEESGQSTGFALRMRDDTDPSDRIIADGVLSWDGTFTVTKSTEGGASTSLNVRGKVESLGYGPNEGRAYRVTLAAPLRQVGVNLRAEFFGCGLSPTSTNVSTSVPVATYIHHAQATKEAGGAGVMVNATSTSLTRNAETFTVPKVNAGSGPLSIYSEGYRWDQPGQGGAPTLSTVAGRAQLAIARGWTSTGGTVYLGGGAYERDGQIISVGSTGPGYEPGARFEELVSISSAGVLTYEVAVNGGTVYSASASAKLAPRPQASIPSYSIAGKQQVLAHVLARGVHSLEDFRGLFE